MLQEALNPPMSCQGKQLCLYIVLTCYYSVKTISNKEDITQLNPINSTFLVTLAAQGPFSSEKLFYIKQSQFNLTSTSHDSYRTAKSQASVLRKKKRNYYYSGNSEWMWRINMVWQISSTSWLLYTCTVYTCTPAFYFI